jgi:ketosteroid isomerase-like protein
MSARTTSRRARQNARVMLDVFKAVQRRDAQRFAELVHPEFEIHWPPSLPYGGSYRDLEVDARQGRPTWSKTWNPLQPTAAERRMDPRVVATSDQEVVVLWRQRGRNPAGERFDTPVLGLYQLRDGRLTRAQMFYFDTVAVAGFLAAAAGDAQTEGHMHPNARLIEAFSQAQRRYYAGDDDTTTLRGLLSDDIAWHVPGRSAIAGDYRGHDQVLGYFAARRKLARASFRVEPHGLLADEQAVVQFATGRLERDGRVSQWETLGVYRIAQGKIAECWLVPFDQYQFDQIWSVQG